MISFDLCDSDEEVTLTEVEVESREAERIKQNGYASHQNIDMHIDDGLLTSILINFRSSSVHFYSMFEAVPHKAEAKTRKREANVKASA